MAQIAFVIRDITSKGGAQNVCLSAIEALKEDYEIDLFSIKEPESLSDMDGFHMKDTSETDIKKYNNFVRTVCLGIEHMGKSVGSRFGRLQHALIDRFVRLGDEYDVVLSFMNEVDVHRNTLCYVDAPNYRTVEDRDSNIEKIYQATCNIIGSPNIGHNSCDIMVNSEWTSQWIEQLYDINASVVYPPVDMSEYSNKSFNWDDREDGFLCVGRISKEKNIIRNIQIIDGLVKEGLDTHLHIIGPPGEEKYQRQISQLANKRQYVQYDGYLEKRELIDMMSEHKFLIHGMEKEHFGMVIAEAAASGMIPFVHNSGGCTEITRSELLEYNSIVDAVSKISDIMVDKDLQEKAKVNVTSNANDFDEKTFKRNIIKAVQDIL